MLLRVARKKVKFAVYGDKIRDATGFRLSLHCD